MIHRTLVRLLLIPLLACLGCGQTSSVRLDSIAGAASLPATLPTSVYSASDTNTADIYLTDLPPERWHPDAEVAGVSGNLVHVHLFIAPKAGRTPIADTALNVTIRHVVLARGQIGLYAGGGFLREGAAAGASSLRARIRKGNVTLVRSTPGFRDRLGPSGFAGAIHAEHDEKTAGVLDARFRSLLDALPPEHPAKR